MSIGRDGKSSRKNENELGERGYVQGKEIYELNTTGSGVRRDTIRNIKRVGENDESRSKLGVRLRRGRK